LDNGAAPTRKPLNEVFLPQANAATARDGTPQCGRQSCRFVLLERWKPMGYEQGELL